MTAPDAGRRSRSRPFAGTPPFPKAAKTALADRAAAREPRRGDDHDPHEASRAPSPSATTGRSCASPGAAIKDEVLRDLPALLEQLEARVTAAGGTVHWARDAAEANAIVAAHRPGRRRRRGRQGQVDGDPGDRAQRRARARRHRRLGDRPRRADRPARARPAVAHPRPGDPPQPARDPRDLPARDGCGRPAGAGGPQRRAAGARGGRPAAPAREVPARQGRDLGREFRGRRDRDGHGRRVGGQRADVPDPPRGPHHGHGHREAGPDAGGTSRSSSSSCRARRPPSG